MDNLFSKLAIIAIAILPELALAISIISGYLSSRRSSSICELIGGTTLPTVLWIRGTDIHFHPNACSLAMLIVGIVLVSTSLVMMMSHAK